MSNPTEFAGSTPDQPWSASCNNLFPTGLFTFALHDYERLNQQLLTQLYQLRQQDPGQSASNVLGWHSRGNLYDLPQFQEFKQLVDAAIVQVAQAVGYGQIPIRPANCWANINPKYASNKIHDHANCLFSGVYYVQTPANSGSIMFYDPRPAKTFYKPLVQTYTAYTADAVAHNADAGLLLIFPSWLRHGVEPNLSEGDRISLSFNYVFA
jgi:uncharacterized protein (TIGR02466 family)